MGGAVLVRLRNARVLAALSVAGAFCGAPGVFAQDLEPGIRAYQNLPIGLNFVLGGYLHTQGGLASVQSLPITDAKFRSHSAVVAYARTFGLLGSSAKIDVIAPHTRISGHARFAGQQAGRDVSGFNDPRVRLTWNFYEAPALTVEEFAGFRQDLIIGASLQVSIPVGQYDSTKLVNIGTNRWFVKPEIGLSKRFGPVTLEIAPSVTFFTANDDFLNGLTREQAPLYAVRGNVVYSFGHDIWAALDTTYHTGGRTTVEGVEGDDWQRNWRVGATLSVPVGRQHSIKIYGSTGISTRTGGDFDVMGVAWQYRW